jgi:hypothetical protein
VEREVVNEATSAADDGVVSERGSAAKTARQCSACEHLARKNLRAFVNEILPQLHFCKKKDWHTAIGESEAQYHFRKKRPRVRVGGGG